MLKQCEVSRDVERAIQKARFDLVRAYPLMNFLILSTENVFTRDLPTAAASTERNGPPVLYNNPDFLMSLPEKQRAWVQLHEVLHLFLAHQGRQQDGGYDPQLWNIACDYVVNLFIDELRKENELAQALIEPWPDQLLDSDYREMTAEQVYQELLRHNNDNTQQAISNNGGALGGDGQAGSQGESHCVDESQGKAFDKVANEKVGEARQSELKQIIAAALSQHGQEKKIGGGMGRLIRTFEALLKPVVPWRDILQQYVETTLSDRTTYKRPSRRSTKNIIFPSRTGERIHLWFGVDTSGSMSSDDLNDAASELVALCGEYSTWKVTLLSCDTGAHILGTWSSEEGDQFETIDHRLMGGGGTDMDPMIVAANETDEDDRPNVLVIVTDGFIPPYEHVEEHMPVITLVTRKGNKHLALDNSLVVHMNDSLPGGM